MNNNLFVGNLAWTVSETELKQTFDPFGEIVSASIILDRETGNSRGFGFVEYTSSQDAQRAMESLDGTELQGRNLAVNVARERSSRGGAR
jgi:RNA recognition motif-containing protein